MDSDVIGVGGAGAEPWRLLLSTFSLVVAGTTHWYATLRPPCGGVFDENTPPDIRVTHRLSIEEAVQLSARDEFYHQAGEESERFRSRDEAVSAGIVRFCEQAPGGSVLRVERGGIAVQEVRV